MKRHSTVLTITALLLAPLAMPRAAEPPAFPYGLPDQKPDRPLSAAMERLYRDYPAVTPEKNELFSNFKFTQLEGFDYHNHDGTVSRRDPSKVIRVNGKYYVWFTKRHTATPPRGAALGTDTIPSSDWDLSEIWYATSDDGFRWKEQGVAVPRPPKPQAGWRSVCTPDILVWKGKYYLYYQGFLEMSGKRGDDCPVTASVADSPDGPWRPVNKIIIPNGAPGDWDQFSIHDPYPLVYHGKIYLYYKSDFNGAPNLIRAQGLAIADDPLGPFVKHPLNPVINSGHETTLFPFKEGIAALAIHNGIEHNTIQFAPDGISFKIAAISSLMPVAAGPYVPDAFTDTRNGRGITWGLSHFTDMGTRETRHSILAHFACDLSQDVHDEWMKKTEIFLKPEVYFSQGLSKQQRERFEKAARHEIGATDAIKPLCPDPAGWTLVPEFSDEFNAPAVDNTKWTKHIHPWGERAWSPDNVFQEQGALHIRAAHEPHTHKGEQYFYKLGILQSLKKTTYGYFEARIKGCSRFPGLCPGFWLYSNGKDRNPKYPKVTYSEIDVVEMLQADYLPALKRRTGANHIDCNLHCRIIDENGKEVWRRPNSLPDVCRHHWTAPWDPRDDYHVYACENTPEEITWYIDGKQVARERNLYWHLPMSVTLTMELRPPFIKWVGIDGRAPVPEATTVEGFPTEMLVDYVRVWKRK